MVYCHRPAYHIWYPQRLCEREQTMNGCVRQRGTHKRTGNTEDLIFHSEDALRIY